MQTITGFVGENRMTYELPAGGISLTGYVARRMHKTELLEEMPALIRLNPLRALAQFGIYVVAAATSFGPARYQPRFDHPGTLISEEDPATGARITVEQLTPDPHYRFTFFAELPGGDTLRGEETIIGTVLTLRGLGMPAPSYYEYTADHWHAIAQGTIYSELSPRLFQPAWIQGFGTLQVSDNGGREGTITLTRSALIRVELNESGGSDEGGESLAFSVQLR